MSDPNKGVLEYRGLLTAKYYNQFFNPNMCYVCKSVDRGNLIFCDQCCLIPYCSEEHKAIHHPLHIEICARVGQILREIRGEGTRRFKDWQQWIKSRKELINLIERRYMPNLDPYMQRVILWAKSCDVCYQQANLRVCQRCFSANYCDRHVNAFRTTHSESKCDRLMLVLNINIETISGNTYELSYDFLNFVDETSCFNEMLEFYIKYVLPQRSDINWLAKDYVQSNRLSEPLTVYSGLKRLRYLCFIQMPLVVIHIIAAMPVNRQCIPAWEILLHLLPEIQKLVIVMIGPTLLEDFYVHTLCEKCRNSGKMLNFLSVCMLYHEYTDSSRFGRNRIPTVIIGFHPQVNGEYIFQESLDIIRFLSCPLFLSFSSAHEVQQFLNDTERILTLYIEPHLKARNHFSGLAPYRNINANDTYFRNEYLIIYGSHQQFFLDKMCIETSGTNIDE